MNLAVKVRLKRNTYCGKELEQAFVYLDYETLRKEINKNGQYTLQYYVSSYTKENGQTTRTEKFVITPENLLNNSDIELTTVLTQYEYAKYKELPYETLEQLHIIKKLEEFVQIPTISGTYEGVYYNKLKEN